MFGKILKGIGRATIGAAAGAVAARGLMSASDQLPKEAQQELSRVNHRGEPVTLVSGSALALAATAAAVMSSPNRKIATAAAIVGLGAGAAGLYDDVVGNRPEQKQDKGFKGHIRALREGRVSAGMVKLAAIGGVSVLAGLLVARTGKKKKGFAGSSFDAMLSAGIIAGTANLMNLLDLRPGRAIKAGIAVGGSQLIGPGGGVAAATVGAAGALLPEDLAEKTMLGDAGANAMGALLGVSIAANCSRVGKLIALAGLVGLNAASEKVSFTKVIAGNPTLNAIDMWGRRPPAKVAIEGGAA